MDNNISDNSNNQALNPDINLNQTFPGLWNYQPNWDEFHMAREQIRPQMRFNIFSLPASSQAQMLGQSEIQMPLEQLPIFYQNQILNQPQQIFMSHLIQQQQQQQQQQYQQSQIQHDQQQQQHQQHQQQLIQQQQQILSQRQQNVVSLSSQSNQSDNPLNQPIDLSFQNYENFVQNNQNGQIFGFSPQYQQNQNANLPSYQFILNLPQPQNQQFNDQFINPNNHRYYQRQPNNVNDRASSQQPIQNDKYYKLNENQVEVSSYDPEEPFMKITVMKSSTGQQSIANNSEFIVTSKGLVKSQKNTTQEDIIIGRCLSQDQLQGPKIIPNDIVLTTSDRAISRVHCKIISKHAFDGTNQITEEFIQFLRLFSRGSKSEYQYLPNHILRSIWEFVKQQKLFYLQDIGSVYGTYVRLYNNQSQQVQKGQIYFIGADNTFNVLECQTENDQNLLEKSESSKDLIANLLAQDFSKLNVHGLTREEYLSIESASELIRCQKQQGNDTFTLDSQPFSRPYLRIEFKVTNLNVHPNQTLPDGDDSFQQHLFFGPSLESNIGDMQIENPQAIFRIGRGGDDNHVRIGHNTISRKQCRFWYCVKSKKWFISDGDQVRESSNGTWISLQNCLDKKQQNDPRLESTQWPLQNGTEIKISESILKVEMFNFNKKQVRTKNNELSQKLLSIVQ